MSLLDNLPHEVDIYELSAADSNIIGDEFTRSVKSGGTGVSAWVQPASQSEITKFAKDGHIVTHKIYFVTDPGFSDSDSITYDGRFFDYRSDADASAGLSVLFKAMFEEVSSEQYLAT